MTRDDTIGPRWSEVMMGRICSNTLPQAFEKKRSKFIFALSFLHLQDVARETRTRDENFGVRRVAHKLKDSDKWVNAPAPEPFWAAVIFFY